MNYNQQQYEADKRILADAPELAIERGELKHLRDKVELWEQLEKVRAAIKDAEVVYGYTEEWAYVANALQIVEDALPQPPQSEGGE